MNFTNLKEAVAAVIKTNGNQEITGAVLQNVLNTIITTMGTGRTFVGIATPTTTAISPLPDGNVFYITKGYGAFEDFNVTVPQGQIYILQNNASGWEGINLMASPDAIALRQARQELTLPAALSANAAVGSGATVTGTGQLTIPVGYTGAGSNAGAITNIPASFGLDISKDVEEITTVGIVQVTGNETEIANKISRYVVEFWNTPGGSPANEVNSGIIYEKLDDNTFLVVGNINGITARKKANGNVFRRLWAGVIVSGEAVTQPMVLQVTTASHFSFKLVDSQPEQSGNKIVQKLIDDELEGWTFSPSFSANEYSSRATSKKGYAGNDVTVGTDANGKRNAVCPANGNPYGFSVGMAGGQIEPGKKYLFRALFKNNGFAINRFTQYFIYNSNGTRYIKNGTVVKNENGVIIVEYVADLTNEQYVWNLELFGMQHTTSATYTTQCEISVEDLAINQSVTVADNSLTNALTQSIISWVEAQNYGVSIRNYSERWRVDLYGDCVPRPGNNGFTCPAGGVVAPSNTVVTTDGMKPGEQINYNIYFRCSDYRGISFFSITMNGGNSIVQYYSPVKDNSDPDVTDRYRINVTFNVPSNNGGWYEWAIQQTNAAITYPDEFHLYWESVSWQQFYEASPTSPGAFEQSIENLINETVNSALGNGSVTTIKVSADPNDPDTSVKFRGKNAIQQALDSITDNSPSKRYRVYVKQGLYKITNSSEFIGYPGYPAMILMKNFVDIEGADRDRTIVWAELPYNDADIDTSITGQKLERNVHQTLWNWARDAYMRHITLVAKNLRYTIHQDSPNSAMYNRGYEDVNVIFIGDKGSLRPWGLGSWNGETNEVKGGRSVASVAAPWACHNNINFQYPTKWRFENHTFISEQSKDIFTPQSDGSLINDFMELIGCSWGGTSYNIDYIQFWLSGKGENAGFDHAEWRFIGYGNDPFLFTNTVRGESLRVVSKSTGANSKVRFTPEGDAYTALIKAPRQNKNVTLYLPETLFVDGYVARDGSVGLPGWANGCCDLSAEVYAYDNGVNYTRMGVRLGDCSTTNKTLTINVDGTDYNVVFNKDYTNVSNADILAEINAVISAVATASLEYYGRFYYPEMPDVSEIVYNASTTDYIPKGTVLKKVQGRVSPATDGDIIAGVALDDIPVYQSVQGVTSGKGRMLKRGYISTDGNHSYYVKAWNGTNTNVAIGDRLKVDAGRLVVDPAGTVTVKDTNVVAINCN